MMRTSELRELAGKWNLKFITIKDIQNYRKCHDILVDRVTTTKMPTRYGEFMAYGFVNRLNGEHHVALVKGEIGDGENVLCRVHSADSSLQRRWPRLRKKAEGYSFI